MVVTAFKYVVLSLYVFAQLATPATDSLGGVSGNDSILRACIASLDASSGLLFLWAIFNYTFEIDRSWIYLSRFTFLHSYKYDDALGTNLRLSARTSWAQFSSTTIRVAKLFEIEVSKPSNLSKMALLTRSRQTRLQASSPRSRSSSYRTSVSGRCRTCGARSRRRSGAKST